MLDEPSLFGDVNSKDFLILNGPATKQKELLEGQVKYLTKLLVLMCTERGFGQDANLYKVRDWYRGYLIDLAIFNKAKEEAVSKVRAEKTIQ